MEKYPIKFVPQMRTALWGREFWLVSAHPAMPSVVANGPYAGRALSDLVTAFGADMTGLNASPDNGFPLLVKVIEAHDRLSLQVHPSETTVASCGGDPKTEMWYVLGGKPGASIYAGLQPSVRRDDLARSLHDGSAAEKIVRFDANPGDVLFIPGGLVHAIGGGCRLYEVQQTSDTTWRLHDWNRIDPKTGKPRPIHEREALAAIDWSLPPPELLHDDGLSASSLIDCVHFKFSSHSISVPTKFPERPESFSILFAEKGSCSVRVEDAASVCLTCGECMLIPAAVPFLIEPSPSIHLLVSSR